MDYIVEKNSIVLFGKNEKLDTLAAKLASLNGKQVYSMFINRGIAVPRKINCLALMSVLNERLKTLHASELPKDYFLRLKHYNDFSEYQLYNLFIKICNTKEHFKEYRTNLFKLILMNFVGLNLADGEVNYLKNLRKLSMEKFETYFHYISSMCQEQENTFDGQDMNKLKNMLVESASNQDILNLASKYGLELALSLKKQELAEIVKYYLSKAGELNKNLEVEIDASTVNGLNSLCKKYRIPISSNLTKPELVNYLFYILDQCQITTTSVRRIETNGMFEPLEFVVDMSAFKGFKPDDTKRVILYRGFEHDEFPPLITEEEAEPQDNSDKPLDFSKQDDNPENTPVAEEAPAEKKAPAKKASSKKKAAKNEESPVEEEAVVEEPITEEEPIAEEAEADGEVIYVDEDGNPVDVEFEEEAEIADEEPTLEDAEEIEDEALVEDEEADEEEIDKALAAIAERKDAPVKEDASNDEALASAEDTPLDESNNTDFKVQAKKLRKSDVRENTEYGNDKLMKAANGPAKVITLSILGALAVIGLVFVIWALLK